MAGVIHEYVDVFCLVSFLSSVLELLAPILHQMSFESFTLIANSQRSEKRFKRTTDTPPGDHTPTNLRASISILASRFRPMLFPPE